jgi:hypothetical protein
MSRRGYTLLETLRQILKFVRVYRKFWMAPLIIGLLLLGGLLVLVEGSAVAPFIYAIF